MEQNIQWYGLEQRLDKSCTILIQLGKQVDAFDYDMQNGMIGNRRKVIEIPVGVPDGMTIDEEGMLWIALWGNGQCRKILSYNW